MTDITIIGAYGRDYKSAKALLEDWNANKDFVIISIFGGDYGRYINKSDYEKYGNGSYLFARYDKKRKKVQIN